MLMIIETRNHRDRIWTATDEADLLARVRAEAEQRRADVDIETVADAIRYTQGRDGSRVQVLTQADYEAVEGWSDEVSATAARIWGLAPAGEDYDDPVVVERMPEHLRASHRAAGNWGSYPANGAERVIVERSSTEAWRCDAEDGEFVGIEHDEYDHIVRPATPADFARYEAE